MKKTKDLSQFTNILPYASEIFGVYQPMLGWRSKRARKRVERGFRNDVARVLDVVRERFKGRFELSLAADGAAQRIARLEPATLDSPAGRPGASFVIDSIARDLPPPERYDEAVWDRVIRPERVKEALARDVVPRVLEWRKGAARRDDDDDNDGGLAELDRASATQLERESVLAGYLLFLKEQKQYGVLQQMFYKPNDNLASLLRVLEFRDPLDVFDPFKDIHRVGSSPIGIVHLFRQYFFEFDTFLGPPVGHVWMSPGASVELLEVSTRKSIIERTFETSTEMTTKTEKETKTEDEISEAVKEENRSDMKFGMNATVNQSWVSGSASASASIDMATTQQKARERAHKHMRQQTEKLSTEIRKNFKSTFRSVTETTDTSSKRYVLQNASDKLMNLELRRKMRQVGVQVQDIGTYLCWQTYVDDPGRQLGIAKLVHVAKGPETADVPPPEAIPRPQSVVTQTTIKIPFVPKTEDTLPEDDMDEAYRDGKEVNLDTNEGSPERIQANFHDLSAECGQPNYRYGRIDFDYGGHDIQVSLRDVVEDPVGKVSFGIHLDHVNFRNAAPLVITANVTWEPTDEAIAKIDAENLTNSSKFSEATRVAFEKAFVEAARERIDKASRIESRRFEDLREEERIVVYRALIQDMLTKDLPIPDDRTRHVVSELLNAIFDIDKMLYFVAPEWWRPRFVQHHQQLGGIRMPDGSDAKAPASKAPVSKAKVSVKGSLHSQVIGKHLGDALVEVAKVAEDKQIAPVDTVAWGGANANRGANYYITESSEPAPLGASLGWLLQLDGDDLRNAFLNAPWVKAVIPIRPGQERAAINWLSRLHVEGTEGLDDRYLASPQQLAEIPHSGPFPTIRDAIDHLCDVVAKKHEESLEVGRYPGDEIDDSNRVSATPVDKVYEHGFYPLQGGFRVAPSDESFEVFDQWIEVLPTDQVVPVEVAYDAKTGRQI